jgi:hypothetical protein
MVCGVCDSQSEAKTVNGVHVVLKDYNERRTTDGLFMIILIAAWVAMTIIGITSGKNGDPKLLIAPYGDDVSKNLFAPILILTRRENSFSPFNLHPFHFKIMALLYFYDFRLNFYRDQFADIPITF